MFERTQFTWIPSFITLAIILCGCRSMPDKTLFVSEKFVSGNMPAFHTYRIDGRTIHYADIGDASLPLVVFVHGSPGSWKTFSGFMADPYLQDKVRMIAVDRPGFGQSESGREVKSLKRQAALLKPILDRNRSGSGTILVGHSFGGPVISRMAMDYSDQVGALIMISPTIDPELENTSWYQHLVKVPLFKILIPKNLITANQEILPLKGELEKMLTHWNQIHVPVYLFHGERDRLVSPENAGFAERMLVNAKLKVYLMPELNHYIPWTRPDLIKFAIIDQLEDRGAFN